MMFIIFRDFLMVEQIFLSPQVKRSVIISNKLAYTSFLTNCQMTEYRKNLKTSQNYCQALNPLPPPHPPSPEMNVGPTKKVLCMYKLYAAFPQGMRCSQKKHLPFFTFGSKRSTAKNICNPISWNNMGTSDVFHCSSENIERMVNNANIEIMKIGKSDEK